MPRIIEAKKLDTPLMIAARNGNAEEVKALIAAGVDIHEVDVDGRNAFMHTSISAKFDTAKLLLNAGADINSIDNNRNSAAHYCVMGRSEMRSTRYIQQLLIKRKANLKIVNNLGMTPLMITAKSGYLEYSNNGRPKLTKILIDANVDVNFRNATGLTALQLAIKDDNEEIAELLIKAGAGPRRKSDHDWEITLNAAKTDAIRAKYAAMMQNQSLIDVAVNVK